jgi:hypothetical protein
MSTAILESEKANRSESGGVYAVAAPLGKDAPNLSPAVISRLTAGWQVDYDAWQKGDLSARRYVYVSSAVPPR